MKETKQKVVLNNPNGSAVTLDYFKIGHGNPRTLLISGIHGNEKTGNIVIERLLQKIKPKGTVTILPIANPNGYKLNQRFEPTTGMDLNRQFSNEDDNLASNIKKIANGQDLIIDIHNYQTAGVIQVRYLGDRAKKLAVILKSDVIRIPHKAKERKLEGTFSGYAKATNISYLLIELPSPKDIKKDQIAKIVDGIKTILENGDTIEVQDNLDSIPHVKIRTVKPKMSGTFYLEPGIELMKHVDEGQILGKVVDKTGKNVENLYSPSNGIICEKVSSNITRATSGKTLIGIGET